MKTCRKCKTDKSLDEFDLHARGKDGRQLYCKSCRKIHNAEYYKRTPERNPQRVAHSAKTVATNQAYILEYLKVHPCVDCGNIDVRVLEFDHVRGEKLFNISESFWRKQEKIANEIAKCEVRCANCHRIVTFERLGKHYRNTLL